MAKKRFCFAVRVPLLAIICVYKKLAKHSSAINAEKDRYMSYFWKALQIGKELCRFYVVRLTNKIFSYWKTKRSSSSRSWLLFSISSFVKWSPGYTPRTVLAGIEHFANNPFPETIKLMKSVSPGLSFKFNKQMTDAMSPLQFLHTESLCSKSLSFFHEICTL